MSNIERIGLRSTRTRSRRNMPMASKATSLAEDLSSDNEPLTRLLAGVCTCKRPTMLESCLNSLIEQLVPSSVIVEIIVVDNDDRPVAQDIVRRVRERSPYTINYKHEPRRGISVARNAVLIHAEWRDCFDWIAFIDDDEVAEPDWISELLNPDYLNVPILLGWHRFIYPKPVPFWAIAKTKEPQEGKSLRTAQTNNVRFSTQLIRDGLRFNEQLAFMGGEDNEFFGKAYRRGFAIRQTKLAVTFETAHPERLTFMGQMYRFYWHGASDMRLYAVLTNWTQAFLSIGLSIPVKMIFGIGGIMISPLLLLAGMSAFKRCFLSSCKQVMKALGRAAAITGLLPKPYRRIVGS